MVAINTAFMRSYDDQLRPELQQMSSLLQDTVLNKKVAVGESVEFRVKNKMASVKNRGQGYFGVNTAAQTGTTDGVLPNTAVEKAVAVFAEWEAPFTIKKSELAKYGAKNTLAELKNGIKSELGRQKDIEIASKMKAGAINRAGQSDLANFPRAGVDLDISLMRALRSYAGTARFPRGGKKTLALPATQFSKLLSHPEVTSSDFNPQNNWYEYRDSFKIAGINVIEVPELDQIAPTTTNKEIAFFYDMDCVGFGTLMDIDTYINFEGVMNAYLGNATLNAGAVVIQPAGCLELNLNK